MAPPSSGKVRECEVCGESYAARKWKTRTCGQNACKGKIVWDKRGRQTLEERFWQYVDKTPGQGPWGDCWGWTGATRGTRNKEGDNYGELAHPYNSGVQTHIGAHVFSYELHVGPVPEGLQVCHECDNPPCTNPYHLIPGTGAENLSEGWERKRWAELLYLADLPIADLIVPAPAFDRLHLDRALEALQDQQRRIITLRFGLEDGTELTLEEVGERFGFTRERARQIEEKALERLRRFYAGHLMK